MGGRSCKKYSIYVKREHTFLPRFLIYGKAGRRRERNKTFPFFVGEKGVLLKLTPSPPSFLLLFLFSGHSWRGKGSEVKKGADSAFPLIFSLKNSFLFSPLFFVPRDHLSEFLNLHIYPLFFFLLSPDPSSFSTAFLVVEGGRKPEFEFERERKSFSFVWGKESVA